jgi:o-succinylbenzoate---CoA ligase
MSETSVHAVRDWLAEAAERSPHDVFVYCPDDDADIFTGLTFAQVNHQVAGYAAHLHNAGVKRGDKVALLMGRHATHIALIFALMRLGAVVVPFNLRLSAAELHYQVTWTGARLLLCDPMHEAHAIQAAKDTDCVVMCVGESQSGMIPRLVESASPDEHVSFLDGVYLPDDTAFVIFTSGTSGRPKRAQITAGNLLASAHASAGRIGVRQDDRWLLSLPLYHVGGLSVIFRSCLFGTAVVLPEELPASRWLADSHQILLREPITLISLVPTQLYRLLETGFTGTPHLRLILLGGAAASPQLLERACALGLPVAPTYGLTEATSQVATMLPADACAKPGSVGRPLPGTHVRIADEYGRTLPAGAVGEIVVAGPTIMRGYLNQPDDRSLREGELFTGDMGYIDGEGDLWLVQRRSDLIVTGGENVYPAEVEARLRQHPEVRDALVVGIADTEWGQRVAAVIVLRNGSALTADLLEAWCRDALAGYKVPRRWLFADSLPSTGIGKPDRRAAAAWFSR